MRKEIRVIMPDDAGRDKGKIFVLKEMPASQAEKWAMRALMALAKAGIEIPDDSANAGFAAIAVLGLKALGNMDYGDAEALMDEMFQCIRIQPGKDVNIVRDMLEEDIEEVATRVKLRLEVFNLHAGFSIAGSPSLPQQQTTVTSAPSNTRSGPTSPAQSRPLSRSVKPPSRN